MGRSGGSQTGWKDQGFILMSQQTRTPTLTLTPSLTQAVHQKKKGLAHLVAVLFLTTRQWPLILRPIFNHLSWTGIVPSSHLPAIKLKTQPNDLAGDQQQTRTSDASRFGHFCSEEYSPKTKHGPPILFLVSFPFSNNSHD